MCVGDPAQCEAMHDQQIYNTVPHKATAQDGDKQHVQLSNRGLEVYGSFKNVIVLTKTHRLTMIKEPMADDKESIHDLLVTGCVELCKVKPVGIDAVDWLGDWLIANNPMKPAVNEYEVQESDE